jgi:hypothetical protein
MIQTVHVLQNHILLLNGGHLKSVIVPHGFQDLSE